MAMKKRKLDMSQLSAINSKLYVVLGTCRCCGTTDIVKYRRSLPKNEQTAVAEIWYKCKCCNTVTVFNVKQCRLATEVELQQYLNN